MSVQWEWLDGSQWKPYHEETSTEIEKAFSSNLDDVVLTQNYFVGRSYMVEFQTAHSGSARQLIKARQFNLETLFARSVRRIVRTSNPESKTSTIASVGKNPPLAAFANLLQPVDMKAASLLSCSVCLDGFTDAPACQLPLCNPKGTHIFHRECILEWLGKKLICPVCKVVCGVMTGDQPDGRLTCRFDSLSLPGYDDCGTLILHFFIPSGLQGSAHPNPGQPYSGTERLAYLPDNADGKHVAALLKMAFDRKLIFTVGQSLSTGLSNCVIWNGIHLKTARTGGASAFGYPDDTYLARVKQELADRGVAPPRDPRATAS